MARKSKDKPGRGGARENAGRKVSDMRDGKLVTMAFRMPEWQIKGMDATAKRSGMTRSELLRSYIDAMLRL